MSYDHTQLTHSSQTAPIKEYRVMWTAQKKQKLKKWHDGTLRFHTFNNRMLLYDETRSLVTDKYLKPGTRIDEGDELEFEQHLVTVEEFLQTVIQDLAPVFAPAMQRARERVSTAVKNGMSPVRAPAQRMGAQPQAPTPRSAPPTALGGGPPQYVQTPLRQHKRPQMPQTPRTRSQVEMGPPPPQWRQGQPSAWSPAPVHRTSAPLPLPSLPPQRQNVGPPVRNQLSRPPQAPLSRPPPPPQPPVHRPELQVRASPESEPLPRPKPPSHPQSSPARARQLRPPQSRPPPPQAPPQPAALPQQQQGSPSLFRPPPPGLQGAPQRLPLQTPHQHPQPPQPLPLQFAGLPPPPSRQRPAQAQPPPPQTALVHASGRAQPANLALEANSDPDLGKPRTPEPGILRLSDPHRKRRKMLAPLPTRMTPPQPQEVTHSRTTPQPPPPARPQPVLQPSREQEQEQEQHLPDKPPPQPQPQPPKRKQLPPGQKPPSSDSLPSASPPPPEPRPRPQSKPTPKPQWKPPAQQSEPCPKRARITTTTKRVNIDSGSDSDPFSPMEATPAAAKTHGKKQSPPGERPQERGKTLAERQAERKDYDDAGPWSREAASLFEWTPW